MSDIKTEEAPGYLSENEIRQGIELLFYAYRDFTAEPDAMLARYGLAARITASSILSAAIRR